MNPYTHEDYRFGRNSQDLVSYLLIYLRFWSGMEERFTITILHNGTEKELSGILRISSYTHQFLFEIGDSEIILEKDDEGNFRALIPPASGEAKQKIDPSLIQALVNEMEKVMKD